MAFVFKSTVGLWLLSTFDVAQDEGFLFPREISYFTRRLGIIPRKYLLSMRTFSLALLLEVGAVVTFPPVSAWISDA